MVPFAVPPNIKEFSISYRLCGRLMIQHNMIENLRETDDKFPGIIGLLAPPVARRPAGNFDRISLGPHIIMISVPALAHTAA